jgi:hypothetical protein
MELSDSEILSILTALLAVLISLVSLYRTHKISVRQLELQETQTSFAKFQHNVLAKEQETKSRADIRLSVRKQGNGRKLVIANIGSVTAKDIIFEAVFDDDVESFLVESEMDQMLPITHLLPGQEITMIIAPYIGSGRSFLAKISWLNEEGEIQKQNQQVTL